MQQVEELLLFTVIFFLLHYLHVLRVSDLYDIKWVPIVYAFCFFVCIAAVIGIDHTGRIDCIDRICCHHYLLPDRHSMGRNCSFEIHLYNCPISHSHSNYDDDLDHSCDGNDANCRESRINGNWEWSCERNGEN